MKKMAFMRKLIEANKYIPLHSTSRRNSKFVEITLKVAYGGLTIILNGQQKKNSYQRREPSLQLIGFFCYQLQFKRLFYCIILCRH